MAQDLAALISAGRELPREERYALASELMFSLDAEGDGEEEIHPEWAAELRRRLDQIDRGEVSLVDGEETMQMAREIIAGRLAQGA